MRAAALLLVCLLLGSVLADGDVVQLKEADFDAFVNNNELVLVKFFAPWCGHCKHLAPEYEKAATILKKENVLLAEVDATEEKELGNRFQVRGYPTLKIFRKGSVSDYNGPREADGIVKYMQKQAGPSVKPVSSVEEAEKMAASKNVIVLAMVTSDKAKIATRFEDVANQMRDDYTFAMISGEDKLKEAGLDKSVIQILRKYPTEKELVKVTYEHKSLDKLESWIRENVFPPVGIYDQDSSEKYQELNKPIVTLFGQIDFKNNARNSMYYSNRLLKVQREYPDMVYTVADATANKREVDEFGGIKGDVLVVINDIPAKKKYRMDDAFSQEAIKKLVEEYKNGALESYIKSEPVPEPEGAGKVRTIVAKTFDELVTKSDKDIFIAAHAPWCGHCKKLLPKLDELAKKLKKFETVMIAKVDATANDIPSDYPIQGYPSVFFKAAGSSKIEKYSGDREVEAMEKYIREHAAHPLKKVKKAAAAQGKEEL